MEAIPASPVTCEFHPTEGITAACRHCGKGMCAVCKQFNPRFCSPACVAEFNSSRANEQPGLADRQPYKFFQFIHILSKLIIPLFLLTILTVAGYWIWRIKFDSSGKIIWQSDFTSYGYERIILGTCNDHIFFRTRDGITTLALASGSMVSQCKLNKAESPPLSHTASLNEYGETHARDDGYLSLIDGELNGNRAMSYHLDTFAVVEAGLLVFESGILHRLDCDGKLQYELKIDGIPQQLEMSSTRKHGAVLSRIIEGVPSPEPSSKNGIHSRVELHSIDFITGKILWTKRPKISSQISHLAVTDNLIVIIFTVYAREAQESSAKLIALDRVSGESRWEKDFNGGNFGWGPTGISNSLYYVFENQFHALTEKGDPAWIQTDGSEKVINLMHSAHDFPIIKEDVVFFNDNDGASCYDLKTGKGLWKTKLTAGSDNIIVTADKIFIAGIVSDSLKSVNMSNSPGFNQAQDVVKDLGLDKLQVTNENRILLALDKYTGKEFWRAENAWGRIVAGEHKLIRIIGNMDKKMGALMNEPDTGIIQYDLNTGKEILTKRFPGIDLWDPMIVDHFAIGYTTDSRTAPGLNTAAIPTNIDIAGRVIAIQLRK